MIKIHLEQRELWDDINNQFVYWGPDKPLDLYLEHSLVSIYKWESKYHKSYLNTENKTEEEALDYIAMMVVGDYEDELDKDIFKALSQEDVKRIDDYLNDPMTATTISEDALKSKNGQKTLKNEIITAEILYYYMTALNIPFECQHWHIAKLVTLIKVCSIKSTPEDKDKKKKLTSSDMALRRARMEAARAKYKKK